MTALTERERQEIRRRVLREEINDVLSVLDALNWAHGWHKALVNRDAMALLESIESIMHRYCESCHLYRMAEGEEEDVRARA